jgi:phosphonate transport system substrate-binding protein
MFKFRPLNLTKYSLLMMISIFSLQSFAEPSPTYTFSIIPQFKPSQLQQEWGPVVERITRESGVKLRIVVPASIAKFDADLTKGIPDFSFMNPYEAAIVMKDGTYLPLLRAKKPLNGILIVKKDSPHKKLTDLEGAIIGFPAPNAFASTLYMRARLSEENSIKFTPKFLNNHNLVYKHILLGHVAAGGSTSTAFNDEAPDVREQLTILYQTPDVASHPISAHKRIPEGVKNAVMKSLLGMQQDAEGRAMLKEIRMSNLVEANYINDYLPVEKLNIQKYVIPE